MASFQAQADISAKAQLSPTGQPAQFDVRLEPAAITGFGTIHFGMRVAEVVAQMAEDYPDISARLLVDNENDLQVLNMVVPDLAPVAGMAAPAPATLNYVFGVQNDRLQAINLDWYADGEATPAQRQALTQAGSAYVATITGYQWPPMKAERGLVIDNSALILFAGRDLQNRGVQVVLKGVPFDILLPKGKSQHHAVDSGPAQLSIRLSLRPDQPADIELPTGSF